MADETTSDFIDLTPKQDGGVLKRIKKQGISEEKPNKNNKVWVHYTGKLLDGTKFDSSVDRNEKFSFNLGKGEVIKAWDLGVASMNKGEVCELKCRADYAYGERGSPPTIPADATLIFDVELFEWEGEDITTKQDKGIIRSILHEGDGYSQPNDDASVKIRFTGKFNDEVFDEREFEFTVGDIGEKNIPSSFNTMVKKMKLYEEAKFVVAPEYAFGTTGNTDLDIPADATVDYNIKLLAFEKSKEEWEMDDNEKLEQAAISKQKGTELLKIGEISRAIKRYEKVSSLLKTQDSIENEEFNKKWGEMKIAAHLNLALCYSKLTDYSKVIENCDGALEINSENEKALYRKGEAFYNIKYYVEGKQEFEKVLKVNPENKLAGKKIQQCTNAIKALHEKERKTFKGMFDKFARQDEMEEIKRKKFMQAAKKNNAGDASNDQSTNNEEEENPEINVEKIESEEPSSVSVEKVESEEPSVSEMSA